MISQILHDQQHNSSTNQEEKMKRKKILTLVTREEYKFDEERWNEFASQGGEKEELSVPVILMIFHEKSREFNLYKNKRYFPFWFNYHLILP